MPTPSWSTLPAKAGRQLKAARKLEAEATRLRAAANRNLEQFAEHQKAHQAEKATA
jgi:hypothetical protein